MTVTDALLIGIIIGMTIQPPVVHAYNYLRWLWRLRKVKLQLDGETRAMAKRRAGDWRGD